ncbi:MAG: flagellar assembly protein A, partial [Spirochaetaceae bacterium]
MVTYEELQAYMKKQAEQDRERTYVHVTGESVEEALRQAAIELGIAIKKIDYEVIEQARSGVFGVGKRDCSILAYPAASTSEDEEYTSGESGYISDSLETTDIDGAAFVRFDQSGVLLKVTKPTGKGVACTERQAIQALAQRGVDSFDRKMVAKIVKFADEKYIKVADYDHNPANDVAMSVDLSDDEMSAWLTLLPPGVGGADPSYDTIVGFLQSHGVVYGFDEQQIRRLEDAPVFRDRIRVAQGTPPKNGADATIAYSFQTDPSQVRLKEKDGRVDFKELNLIQNVVEGQTLAKKIPAERGEAGRTVTDQLIPAEDGKDITIEAGKNVAVTEDGSKAVAEINGQVVLAGGKLNVEPVYVVAGDVSLKTGNVLFLGTV